MSSVLCGSVQVKKYRYIYIYVTVISGHHGSKLEVSGHFGTKLKGVGVILASSCWILLPFVNCKSRCHFGPSWFEVGSPGSFWHQVEEVLGSS